MLTTESPQHLKHSCDPDEFEAYKKGFKTFDIKLNDGTFNLQEGDLLTLEECDPSTGQLTGRKELRRVGKVLNTASIENITGEDVATKGLSIFSLVASDYLTLYSLYGNHFSVSVAVDRHDENEYDDETNWHVFGEPAYTPILSCPDFIRGGILDSLNIQKWPGGRYSITLLIEMDFDKEGPPYEVNIIDAIIMTMIADPEKKDDFVFAELLPEVLATGVAIHLITEEKVEPLPIDKLNQMYEEPMTTEELEGNQDLISMEQMQQLIEEAKSRGEDVTALEEALNAEDEDDNG